jgi:hypothetical protein
MFIYLCIGLVLAGMVYGICRDEGEDYFFFLFLVVVAWPVLFLIALGIWVSEMFTE